MSENARITRAFSVIGLSTLASRILGLAREMMIAFYFGAGMAADAFFVAFQIPNTFRRLTAEGSLTISFIPVTFVATTGLFVSQACKIAEGCPS